MLSTHIRARPADKDAFQRLLLETQAALGRPLQQADLFALLVAYAEGDEAGFLGWAGRHEAPPEGL